MNRLLILLSMLAACHAALAQPWTFTRIVDTDTQVPGRSENFNIGDAFQSISIYGDRVRFLGRAHSGWHGVYEWRQGVGRKIADEATTIPFSTDKFSGFAPTSSSASGVSFGGGGGNTVGFYHDDGTALSRIVDQSIAVPDGIGTFSTFGSDVHTVGDSTVFRGVSQNYTFSGVYRNDSGILSRVVDMTMSPTNRSDLFSRFKTWRLEADSTYFSAVTATGYSALFKSHGGVLSTLVDDTMSLPDGRHLSNPNGPCPDGETVLFKASVGTGHNVLATKSGESIQLILDDAMDPPGPSTSFNGINQFDYQNGALVFGANDLTIYTNYGGVLQRLVGPGDIINGKVVTSALFNEHGFDGATAAFWVTFQGDSSFHYDRAICTVTIPAPGAAGLALIPALATSPARRRRPAAR